MNTQGNRGFKVASKRLSLGRTILPAVVAAFALLIAQAPAALAQHVGQRVLAHWSKDQYSYPATIVERRGDSFYIQFDDGDEEWTSSDNLFPEDLKVGSRVYANWKRRGRYYPGVITWRSGDSIHIAYDDGDREDTTIAVVRVLR